MLSMTYIDLDCITIFGNFNIRVDSPQDEGTKQLWCILDIFVSRASEL